MESEVPTGKTLDNRRLDCKSIGNIIRIQMQDEFFLSEMKVIMW